MTLSADNPIEMRYQNGVHVSYLAQLLEDPALWNQHRLRTTREGPHRHVDDIWVRCLDWGVMRERPEMFNQPHESSWYPVAHNELHEAKSIAGAIMQVVGGKELGGVLITRIPAGCCVLPHVDEGWHARAHRKFAVQIQANDLQEFCFEKKRLVTRPGDVFEFDNQYSHWVTNPSSEPRVTMIVCVRREPSNG